jgi:hypothetical protein
MLTAREPRRVRDLRAFLRVGRRAVDEDGDPGSGCAGHAGAGSSRSRAMTAGSRLWPGGSRSIRWRAWRTSRPGDGDQPPAQGGDHGLAAAHAVPCQDVLPCGDGGELVQPGGHARCQPRAPHPGQVHLGISGGAGRRRRACCRGRCSPLFQCLSASVASSLSSPATACPTGVLRRRLWGAG